MSDFMITIGILKTMFSTLFFVSALLIALNRTSVQDYFERHITNKKVNDVHVAVVTDYITCLTYILAASVMRLISGFAIFVGEYSELIEVRVVAIVSYLLDIVCLGAFMYYVSERVKAQFADFISITLSTVCGLEFIIFLCMCIATTFSLHEFEFKARWEELRRKRKALKARKARKAKEVAAKAAAKGAAATAAAKGPAVASVPAPGAAPAIAAKK